jgi:hypothetical protein
MRAGEPAWFDLDTNQLVAEDVRIGARAAVSSQDWQWAPARRVRD